MRDILRPPYYFYEGVELAVKLIGGKKEVEKKLVIIGATEQKPFIKWYIKTSNKEVVKAMREFVEVVIVDEHRSTMLCSGCYKPAITSNAPHRYQHCKECGICWNRDINNAGRNILYIGQCHLTNAPMNEGFHRTFKFKGNAKSYFERNGKPPPHTRRDTTKLRQAIRSSRRTNDETEI